MVLIFAELERKWQWEWILRPHQKVGMSVEDYYTRFCDWRHEMIILSFPALEGDYIDGFIANLRSDVVGKLFTDESCWSSLIDAYHDARFAESMMIIEEQIRQIKAHKVFDEMPNPESKHNDELQDAEDVGNEMSGDLVVQLEADHGKIVSLNTNCDVVDELPKPASTTSTTLINDDLDVYIEMPSRTHVIPCNDGADYNDINSKVALASHEQLTHTVEELDAAIEEELEQQNRALAELNWSTVELKNPVSSYHDQTSKYLDELSNKEDVILEMVCVSSNEMQRTSPYEDGSEFPVRNPNPDDIIIDVAACEEMSEPNDQKVEVFIPDMPGNSAVSTYAARFEDAIDDMLDVFGKNVMEHFACDAYNVFAEMVRPIPTCFHYKLHIRSWNESSFVERLEARGLLASEEDTTKKASGGQGDLGNKAFKMLDELVMPVVTHLQSTMGLQSFPDFDNCDHNDECKVFAELPNPFPGDALDKKREIRTKVAASSANSVSSSWKMILGETGVFLFDPGITSWHRIYCDFVKSKSVKQTCIKVPNKIMDVLWGGKVLMVVFIPEGSWYYMDSRHFEPNGDKQHFDSGDWINGKMVFSTCNATIGNGFQPKYLEIIISPLTYKWSCISVAHARTVTFAQYVRCKGKSKSLTKGRLKEPMAAVICPPWDGLVNRFGVPIVTTTLEDILTKNLATNNLVYLKLLTGWNRWMHCLKLCSVMLPWLAVKKNVLNFPLNGLTTGWKLVSICITWLCLLFPLCVILVWDPGPCAFFAYILLDKDVVERVGKDMVLMDITWVIRRYDHEVEMSCLNTVEDFGLSILHTGLDTLRLGKFELGLIASDLKHFKQYSDSHDYDDVFIAKLQNLVWDPGQNNFFLYILEDMLRPKMFKLHFPWDTLNASRGLPNGF